MRSRIVHHFKKFSSPDIASRAVFLAALFLLSLGCAFPLTAFAAERILSFHSNITVKSDSTLVVEETIKVVSEGIEIRRGIYRDFPLKYPGKWGLSSIVGFEMLGITRDGSPEPYHTEYEGNGVRVYIGSKDVFIENGEHTYTIRYFTDRQLGFFAGRDELYWNVTGNGWVFPIEKASASITLPSGIPPEELTVTGYTGPSGFKGKDFIHSIDASGGVHFSTAKTLRSYEGLTIAVSWPKGFVREPTSYMKFRYFLRDAKLLITAVFGIAALMIYYLLAWRKVGKDPEAGVIMPLYAPPPGYSPASVRYVSEMGYDAKAFTAAVVGLAVKGLLDIEEKDKVYTVKKVRKIRSEAALTPEETKFYAALPDSLEFKQSNHASIASSIDALKKELSAHYNKKYFATNYVYLLPGAAITLLSLAALYLTGDAPPGVFIVGGFVSIFGGVVAASIFSSKTFKFLLLAALSFGASALAVIAVLNYIMLIDDASAVAIAAFLLMLAVNFVFSHLLKAPTKTGRALLDKIEGFKMYLAAAESDRLNRMNPPDKTPALFEAYLPYALALNVENEWAEQFTAVFEKISVETGKGYSPSWYYGPSFGMGGAMSAGGFASSLGSSFTGAVSSSSTAPGSSSGGGGGGSSGGGGGGGGGGGW